MPKEPKIHGRELTPKEQIVIEVGEKRRQLNSVITRMERISGTSESVKQRFPEYTSGTAVPSQDKLTQALVSPAFQEESWNYFHDALHAIVDAKDINHFFAPFWEEMPKLLQEHGLENQADVLHNFFNRLETENPVSGGDYDQKDFFWTLANYERKSTLEQQTTMLDSALQEASEPNDILLAGLLLYLDNRIGNLDLVKGENISGYQSLMSAVKRYFADYRTRVLDARFSDAAETITTVFPEGSVMLPVAIATSLATHVDWLPSVFDNLLKNNLVPGLTPDSQETLSAFYEQTYLAKHPGILETPDDAGEVAYQLVRDAYKAQTSFPFLQAQAAEYNTQQQTTEDNHTEISWLKDKKKFDSVRKALLGLIREVSSENGITFDITSQEQTIDLLVYNQQTLAAFAIQIDQEGRVVGIPEDMEADVMPYIHHLFVQAQEYIETNVFSRSQEKKQPTVPSLPGRRQSSVETPVTLTREQRMAEYQERKNRMLKRKQLRDAESIHIQQESAAMPAQQEAGKSFSLTLIPSPEYEEQLQKLAEMNPNILNLVAEARNKITNGEKKLKKLGSEFQKPGSPTTYAVRINGIGNKGARIKLVQSPNRGELIITSIDLRGVAYDELEKDFRIAEKVLDSLGKK